MKLPESHESHIQERKSLIKLQSLLPAELFIMREETGGDYGTDRVVELIVNGKQISNYRFHAQGKSAKNLSANSDGSHSHPVPIKTLNYLLNQPNSAIFLFLEDQDSMKWAWVEEVFRDAKLRGIDLTKTEQEEISYRFNKILDRGGLDEIYQKVLKRGQFLRQVSQLIAYASPANPPHILLHPAQNTAVDIDQLITFVKQYGFYFINTGQLTAFEQILSRLPNSISEDPNIAYVVSYAKNDARENMGCFKLATKR